MSGEIPIAVVGSLTADLELRYTQSGLAVANGTVASNSRTFDRQANDWKDDPATFLRFTLWREMAEQAAGSLTKGTRVIVVGKLRQRDYETAQGEKRTSFEIEVDEIGPSLKFATASVTRTGSRTQAEHQQQRQGGYDPNGGVGYGQAAEEPWAASAPAQAEPLWNQPGQYDETPF